MAETLVWRDSVILVGAGFELSSLLFLLNQMRLHLQQGMQLALQLKQGKQMREIQLPFFKPQLLEKIAPIAKQRSPSFFTKALSLLFDMEMLAKNSSSSPTLLLDLLMVKMHHLKIPQ